MSIFLTVIYAEVTNHIPTQMQELKKELKEEIRENQKELKEEIRENQIEMNRRFDKIYEILLEKQKKR